MKKGYFVLLQFIFSLVIFCLIIKTVNVNNNYSISRIYSKGILHFIKNNVIL